MNELPSELCQDKIQILKDYVEKGEKILSSIEDWESLAEILEERDELIDQLQKLELQICEKGSNLCSLNQKNQIDNLVKLILDLDKSCIQLIQAEQKKTIQDLKNNQQNQKVATYEINMTPSYGTFLDAKK